ncbi:LysR family transcriptional regulator [Oceanobacillus caeni]
MDLLQLEYFKAVARLEHISRAIEELHTSQSKHGRGLILFLKIPV